MEDPQYWECRATIEKLKGDIGLALECYKTAVVQGAEVSMSSRTKSLEVVHSWICGLYEAKILLVLGFKFENLIL